jgi:flagellar FliL protein
MAEKEEVTNQDFKESKGAGGGGNPLLTVLVLVNTLMVGAVAFMQWSFHQKNKEQPSVQDLVKAELKAMGQEESTDAAKQPIEEDGILFPLEGFTANLAQDDGPRRFVRLNAVLKFSKVSSEEEFKSRKPQIRDAIISILNSKRPTDLLQTEGKNFLKEEIKSSINAFLVDGSVIDVFYVGFQIN